MKTAWMRVVWCGVVWWNGLWVERQGVNGSAFGFDIGERVDRIPIEQDVGLVWGEIGCIVMMFVVWG